MPRWRARSSSVLRLPRMTSAPSRGCAASITQRSGPMPAGSPAVRATRGSAFFVAVLDERAIARLAQPVLVRLVGLARANRLACGGLLPLLGHFVPAAPEPLHQVPPDGRPA